MANGTLISINTTQIGNVSSQTRNLSTQMESTRSELRNLQSQLTQAQNLLDKHYRICFDEVIPAKKIQKQKQRMNEIVSLLAYAEQLAGDTSNKLNTRANALKLFVKAMSGITVGPVITSIFSALGTVASVVAKEKGCGDDFAYIDNWALKQYTNSNINWSTKYNGTPNDYSDFKVISNFKEDYALNQHDYYQGDIACTATCDAIAGSIVKNQKLTPDKSYWNERSCNWPNTKKIKGSGKASAEEQCQIIFDNLSEGIPVILRVPNHSVIAIGVRDGVERSKITPADILVVDPGDGKVKTADELYSRLYPNSKGSVHRTMHAGSWDLRIPK